MYVRKYALLAATAIVDGEVCLETRIYVLKLLNIDFLFLKFWWEKLYSDMVMKPLVIEARANTRTESAKIRNRRLRKKVNKTKCFLEEKF